jgi:predicted XRE-type DNA-binding protein
MNKNQTEIKTVRKIRQRLCNITLQLITTKALDKYKVMELLDITEIEFDHLRSNNYTYFSTDELLTFIDIIKDPVIVLDIAIITLIT